MEKLCSSTYRYRILSCARSWHCCPFKTSYLEYTYLQASFQESDSIPECCERRPEFFISLPGSFCRHSGTHDVLWTRVIYCAICSYNGRSSQALIVRLSISRNELTSTHGQVMICKPDCYGHSSMVRWISRIFQDMVLVPQNLRLALVECFAPSSRLMA